MEAKKTPLIGNNLPLGVFQLIPLNLRDSYYLVFTCQLNEIIHTFDLACG